MLKSGLDKGWPFVMRPWIILLSILSTLALCYFIFEPEILRGQIGKQSFSAEMARSFSRGQTQGIFAIRHFVEFDHPGPLAWAEEAPVYTATVGFISHFTQIPIGCVGKAVSLLAFLFLLWGSFLLGRHLQASVPSLKNLDVLIPFTFLCFPVFRLYGVSVMPDLAMASFCLWGILKAWENKWKQTAIYLSIGSLLKFFAVFTVLGLGLYAITHHCYSSSHKRKIILYLFLSIIPIIIYLFWMLSSGVANPIIEYRRGGQSGHLASFFTLSQWHSYIRICTWVLIKNPTILGSSLALWGLVYIHKHQKNLFQLSIYLLASGLIFALIFLNSFFVHDYYAIQISLVTALLAGVALATFKKWKQTCIMIGLAAFGFIASMSAFKRQDQYFKVRDAIEAAVPKKEPIILLSSESTSPLFYLLDQPGWMVNPKQIGQFPQTVSHLLQRKDLHCAAIYFLQSEHPEAKKVVQFLNQNGWTQHGEAVPIEHQGRLWFVTVFVNT